MKSFAKVIVTTILNWQVRRLIRKHPIKVVGVAGSVGKTSTKFAIAQVLGQSLRVRYQEGNYNDAVTVPLVFFDQKLPSLFNALAWLRVFNHNEKVIKSDYPVDIVVVELGTDGPGQLLQFGKYLSLDIGVVTAIAPEHMEFFETIDQVAAEELTIAKFSGKLLYNRDLCAEKYLSEFSAAIPYDGNSAKSFGYEAVSEAQYYSVSAAIVVAEQLGLKREEIENGISAIQPVSGRMQVLPGSNGSTIIDDTYNASPEAAIAALDALYAMPGKQKIALLGNMNELGAYSERAHRQVGEHCDPQKLSLVVTLGPDANQYLAAAAEKAGCQVRRTDSPYEAGEIIKQLLEPSAVILAKGSQNRVFAEEAVKLLLADPADSSKLVRQSDHWLSVKAQQFGEQS
jgi:UDP-N-acetylmuramoyl-tripeptide--D-alanyl-D-alanine ligase